VRRVSVVNDDSRAREIDLTSYLEVMLAPPAADAAHPAFSKLFVRTEFLPRTATLLAERRRRAPDEPALWAAHFGVVEAESAGAPEFETDRALFLGRGREARTPMAVIDGLPLSNTAGNVLDPVFALRYRLKVPPGRTVRVSFWTIVGSTREEILDLVDKHCSVQAYERAATLAWTQAQVQLAHLGIGPEEADLFQRLASRVLFADPLLRPSPEILKRGAGAPPALWTQGISGDFPIVVVRIDSPDDLAVVRQLLRAHEYWRMKQLSADLVILNERGSSYVQDLQIALESLVAAVQARVQFGRPIERRSVFVLRSDLISAETRGVLLARANAVLTARLGTLSEQLGRWRVADAVSLAPRREGRPGRPAAPPLETSLPDLEFFNGLGGFAKDGREYVTVLNPGRWVPTPWINVVANPAFGFQVAAEGSGYTWSIGSKENQLTPWSNDPVTDRPGEVIYVRDEESGALWGATALPMRDESDPYIARHGQGYSRFEHTTNGCRARSPAVRAAARSDQDLAAHGAQYGDARAAAVGHRVRRVGHGPVSQRLGAVARDGDRPGDRSDARAQSLEHDVRRARRLRRFERAPDGVDRGPARVPRQERYAGQSRGACSGRRARAACGRGSRCLRRAANRRSARPRRERGDRILPRRGRHEGIRAGAHPALPVG
jgi:cyclic beta-1,2-glucan synthetase